jgi:FtsP/CotA-like multicopper oxidase with cupredoxin domain
LLLNQNGLSPFAKSAFADIPTGTPLSPVGHNPAEAFKTPLLRLNNLEHHTLDRVGTGDATKLQWTSGLDNQGLIPLSPGEQFSSRVSNDVKITHKVNLVREGGVQTRAWPEPGLLGPAEGRPPGEYFSHQRWDELVNKQNFAPKGAVMSHGQIGAGVSYNLAAGWPEQNPNAVWTFGEGRFVEGGFNAVGGLTFPNLLQARYGEPLIFRNYNNLPFDPAENGGFGRNEPTTHNHNGHNGAESDGAGNAHFFPGEYYDYLYSTMLARRDEGLKMSDGRDLDKTMGIKRGDARASGPTDNGDIALVPGDFREIQGTLWFHDHRISFTSENVHKGYAALMEYFSGPDRGYERPGLSTTPHNGKSAEDVNFRLPSGWRNGKTWGNRDFDVYLAIQDVAFDRDGQLFFDIFDTEGFLGDVMHVNYQWKPTMNVLPRKYRFRTLSAGMSRWVQLAVSDSLDPNTAKPVPLTMIANDGNIFPRFLPNLPQLNIQATAERYDFIVDFSPYLAKVKAGQPVKLYLVNLLEFSNGRKPDKTLTLAEALSGQNADPVPGAIMEFNIASSVPSIDEPGAFNTIANACGANDMSLVNDPGADWQIPTVRPVRTREIKLTRGGGDGGLPFDHPEGPEPWAVSVNGGASHGADMRRASNLPRPGDVEHWDLRSGGGWGHPLHLHFEEAITLSRGGKTDPRSIHPGEFLKRKDMWHVGALGSLGEEGEPKIQVAFGEFGGAYVNHCHNTVHEDNAMLIHYHLAKQGVAGSGIEQIHATVLPTPDPRVTGVTYVQSCFLKEGNPQGFNVSAGAQPDSNGNKVVACPPAEVGPVVGAQGEPPAGYVDLSGFKITP